MTTVYDTMVAKLMEDYGESIERADYIVQSVKDAHPSDVWDKDASKVGDRILTNWYTVIKIQRKLRFT